MFLCKVCFWPVFPFTWVALRMAHLRRFWSSLYEKRINIEVYWTWFFTLCTLYSVFYKTQWETGNLFMFFPEQSFERCLPSDSYSHILCLSCGGQLFESEHASFMKGSKASWLTKLIFWDNTHQVTDYICFPLDSTIIMSMCSIALLPIKSVYSRSIKTYLNRLVKNSCPCRFAQ